MRDLAASLEDEAPDLPMTPLIDMVFLLLAFFIFATQLKQQTADQQVVLPSHQGPGATGAQAENGWQIEVEKTGQLTLFKPNAAQPTERDRSLLARADQPTMDAYLPQLKALAAAETQAHPGPLPEVELQVDQAAPFGRVSEVWAALQLAGFTKIRVPYHLTQPAEAP